MCDFQLELLNMPFEDHIANVEYLYGMVNLPQGVYGFQMEQPNMVQFGGSY